jgi:hypothetical protein
MAATTDCARRLGLAFSQVTAEDRGAFGSVGQEAWSYAWAARVAAAARAFGDALGAMRHAGPSSRGAPGSTTMMGCRPLRQGLADLPPGAPVRGV